MTKLFLSALPFLLTAVQASAQNDGGGAKQEGNAEKPRRERMPVHGDTIQRKKLTLVFADNDSTLAPEYKQRLVDAYFEQYPKLVKKYNKESPKLVTFFLDKNYKGVAATGGGMIRYNPAWFHKNPEDIDVVTHELMHVVQGYGYNGVPVWVTEGIADYVRATEGINNDAAKWTMPELKPEHTYTASYRITARFFVWITQHYDKKFVQKLDAAAREKKYSVDTWKDGTGKNLDELWAEYTADPSLK